MCAYFAARFEYIADGLKQDCAGVFMLQFISLLDSASATRPVVVSVFLPCGLTDSSML